jgi:hypothetical protein
LYHCKVRKISEEHVTFTFEVKDWSKQESLKTRQQEEYTVLLLAGFLADISFELDDGGIGLILNDAAL